MTLPASTASSSSQRALGRWLVFLATVFWGTTATLARSVFRDQGVPAQTVVELRLTIAASLLLAWLLVRNRAALRVARADLRRLLFLGLFGVAAVQGTYYYSISRLGVGLAILLQYVAPSLIVLWEMARGKRPSPATISAVLMALAGTALLVRGVNTVSMHATPFDWIVGASSAFIFAFYVLASKRVMARHEPETVLLYTFAIAALFWACVTPPWRLKRLPAAEAGILATAEPVVAIVSAYVFLGESLGPWQLAGAGMVIVAAVLASRGQPDAGERIAERG